MLLLSHNLALGSQGVNYVSLSSCQGLAAGSPPPSSDPACLPGTLKRKNRNKQAGDFLNVKSNL